MIHTHISRPSTVLLTQGYRLTDQVQLGLIEGPENFNAWLASDTRSYQTLKGADVHVFL
jgi:hypothetical protein